MECFEFKLISITSKEGFAMCPKVFLLFMLIVIISVTIVTLQGADDGELDLEDLPVDDIIFDDESEARNAIVREDRKWPKGKIPYVIDAELERRRKNILEVMKHYEDNTCLRFMQRSFETNYINLYVGKGCSARVGMKGVRNVSLGNGCYGHGTIVHELGHVIGFYHEHQRSDRDDHIAIHWENVREGAERNFEKLKPSENRLLSEYDYDSIMHYAGTSFSKNKNLKTMTPKHGDVELRKVNEKKFLSAGDIAKINKLYDC